MNYNEIGEVPDFVSSFLGGNTDSILGLGLFFILICALFFLSIWFIKLLCEAFIFKKAGRNPWLVFVPFYGRYILCDIALGLEWFGLVYCLWPLALCSLASDAKWIQMMSGFAVFIMNVILNLNLAKRFNKGAGFAIGLIVLPVIFYPILAFGKSKYISIGQEKNNNDDSDFEQNQIRNDYDEINNYAQDQEINFSSNNNKDDENEN